MAESSPPRKKLKRQSKLTESETKRKRKNRDRQHQKTRVFLGSEWNRWILIKQENQLTNDRAVATFLIDHYRQTCDDEAEPVPVYDFAVPGPSGSGLTSTPEPKFLHKLYEGVEKTPSVSEISAADSERDDPVVMSGVEEMKTSESETEFRKSDKLKFTKAGRQIVEKGFTHSFVDPFNLSIEVTNTQDSEDENDDPEYEPSFCLTAILPDKVNEDYEDVPYEELEFGLEVGEGDEPDESSEPEEAGITTITTEAQCRELTQSVICLAFLKQLLVLAETNITVCGVCGNAASLENHFVGSALYLKWMCTERHVVHTWCSQPILNHKLHSGDFLVCASTVISGNNYGNLALWAEILGLRFPSSDQFHRIQRSYIIKAVDQAWDTNQAEVIEEFRNTDVVIMGDGRNDSPGHSAQFCSYTFMEHVTKKILTMKTLDKRQTQRKSMNMEKLGFEEALKELEEKGLTVSEVVTDAHTVITSLMKTQHPEMKHSYDIWHVAKNLGKKIVKIAQKKQNQILLQWSRDIINHFWFACQKAETYSELVGIWRSVLHHITNQHEWIIPHGGDLVNCLHGPLTDEDRNKPWLNPSKHAQVIKDLSAVVLDKRLLNKVEYYLNFRSTAELEGFHQHILMYCAKRFAYTPPVYRTRNLLAALDHNKNSDREIQKNRDGSIRYHRTWNKKSGRWSVHPCRVKKSYEYTKDIIESALILRVNDKIGMSRKQALEDTDPRRLSKTLAPVEPPATLTLVEQRVSRFQ